MDESRNGLNNYLKIIFNFLDNCDIQLDQLKVRTTNRTYVSR